MVNHNTTPAENGPAMNDMGAYFGILARGTEYYTQIAFGTWDTMAPSQRLELQEITREFAGDDVALGQEFARSQLVFVHVTSHAQAAGRAALAGETAI